MSDKRHKARRGRTLKVCLAMTCGPEGCYVLGVSATLHHAQERFLGEPAPSKLNSWVVAVCPVDAAHSIPFGSERGYRIYYKDAQSAGLHDGWEEQR